MHRTRFCNEKNNAFLFLHLTTTATTKNLMNSHRLQPTIELGERYRLKNDRAPKLPDKTVTNPI